MKREVARLWTVQAPVVEAARRELQVRLPAAGAFDCCLALTCLGLDLPEYIASHCVTPPTSLPSAAGEAGERPVPAQQVCLCECAATSVTLLRHTFNCRRRSWRATRTCAAEWAPFGWRRGGKRCTGVWSGKKYV